jgi:hypothetical protein
MHKSSYYHCCLNVDRQLLNVLEQCHFLIVLKTVTRIVVWRVTEKTVLPYAPVENQRSWLFDFPRVTNSHPPVRHYGCDGDKFVAAE